MDQGSNKNHSPINNFTPTVTKFCVMWEGQALPHDTKFGNCKDKIVDSRAFLSWSLIHGSSWSRLIKAEPVSPYAVTRPHWVERLRLIISNWHNHKMKMILIIFSSCWNYYLDDAQVRLCLPNVGEWVVTYRVAPHTFNMRGDLKLQILFANIWRLLLPSYTDSFSFSRCTITQPLEGDFYPNLDVLEAAQI